MVGSEKLSHQAQFNRRWRPALMAFFMRRVGVHAEAEDLTQEVFVRLLQGGDTVAKSPDAYVFQVAANLLRDRARRAKVRDDYRESIAQIGDLELDTIDPHRIAVGRAALGAVTAAIADLPERTRMIFTLYKIEQIDLDTIAESYGISRSGAKKHVIKAMAAIMQRTRGTR